jgi:hypothetical protein
MDLHGIETTESARDLIIQQRSGVQAHASLAHALQHRTDHFRSDAAVGTIQPLRHRLESK